MITHLEGTLHAAGKCCEVLTNDNPSIWKACYIHGNFIHSHVMGYNFYVHNNFSGGRLPCQKGQNCTKLENSCSF
jgi:hypothetical protein